MRVSRLALGTVQFGLDYGIANCSGQPSQTEIRSILATAHSAGLDTLDTAIGYGQSEQRLGEVDVGSWKVVSKLPGFVEEQGPVGTWIQGHLQKSLERLRLKRLEAILLHRPIDLLGPHGSQIYSALQQAKSEGLCKKIGISVYGVEEIQNICERFSIDLIQVPFSVFDRHLVQSGWLARLKQVGIEVHVRSVFLQGLLLMSPRLRFEYFERWKPLFELWQSWLNENGISALEACIRFALSEPDVDRVIIGVDSEAQLKEVISASERPMLSVPECISCNDSNLINPSSWQLA